MTQTSDLIKKMADFFTSEEFYEKGEDARLALTPDDVRCMNYLIQQRNKYRAERSGEGITAEETKRIGKRICECFEEGFRKGLSNDRK